MGVKIELGGQLCNDDRALMVWVVDGGVGGEVGR